jgi:uncharacterized protein (TIGR02246 family)
MISTGWSTSARADARQSIEAANAAFAAAYSQRDTAAVAAMYTAGGQLLAPNEKVIEGRPAIEKYWKGAMDAGVKSVKLDSTEVESLGDSAFEVGSYTLFGTNGAAIDKGKYIVIWKRIDGAWKLHRDCWNTTAPQPRAAEGVGARQELDILQGKWKTVAGEAEGEPFPSNGLPDFAVVIGADGKSTVQTPQEESKLTIKVNGNKNPKTIDNLHETGNEQGKWQYGIYKVEGDRFTVCMSTAGSTESDRPKDFTTKNTTHVLFVFERVKEDKKP